MNSRLFKIFSFYLPWLFAFGLIFIWSDLKAQTSKDAEAFYNQGVAYYNKNQLDLAIESFNRAVKIDPKFALAYNNRGMAYLSDSQYDFAINDFTKALQLDQKLSLAYNNRGMAYLKKKKYDLAIYDFGKAIGIDQKFVLAYINRGMVYHEKGQYDLAILDFSKALELDPKNSQARNNIRLAETMKSQADLSRKAPEQPQFQGKPAIPPKPGCRLNPNLSVDVFWDKVLGAKSYKVYCSSSKGSSLNNSYSKEADDEDISFWPKQFPVYCRVVAVNGEYQSEPSDYCTAAFLSSQGGTKCQICGAPAIGYCHNRRIYVCKKHNIYTSEDGTRWRCP